MGCLSNYFENKIIDHLRGVATFTPPATWYFALLTAAPSDSGGGTEVTGGSYARVAMAANGANLAGTQAAGSTTASTGTSGTTSNNNPIVFPAPTADWGTATHLAVYDASTGGNLLIYVPLSPAQAINNGNTAPTFAAGDFSFSMD